MDSSVGRFDKAHVGDTGYKCDGLQAQCEEGV